VALRAAASAGNRLLAAYVLSALSHHCLSASEPHEALLLATTGYAGVRNHGTPLTRALLLHRIALAAAWAKERREAEKALYEAERVVDRSGQDKEPDWLHWLDERELTAMTGRCLVVLGRPVRAVRLLAERRDGVGPRTAALYGTWLARGYLALGEVEQAHEISAGAMRLATASASARAVSAVRYLRLRGCGQVGISRSA
jgi:hypothetical protein